MSNNMNEVTEQIGNVQRASNSMASNAIGMADASLQTRMRQDHIRVMTNGLMNGEYRDEAGHVDANRVLFELNTITERCPSAGTLEGHREAHGRAQQIVDNEIQTLYQQVEKMRELQAAVASDVPPTLPTE